MLYSCQNVFLFSSPSFPRDHERCRHGHVVYKIKLLTYLEKPIANAQCALGRSFRDVSYGIDF